MRLKDKVIVITGSTKGIGYNIAKACASDGAIIVISSRKKESVENTIANFSKTGYKASGLVVDVTKEENIHNLFNHTIDKWGKIDVWINNAGISGPYKRLHEWKYEEIEQVINTNLTGLLKASKIVLPYFIKDRKGGILINFVGRGYDGSPSPFNTTYASTKVAVNSLTKSLAKEYEKFNISIHSVMPGMVDTDMIQKVEYSKELEKQKDALPYVMKAFSVPINEVGQLLVDISAQTPGKTTGKCYSLLNGWRMFKGGMRMMYYGITGKLKGID